MEMDLGSECSLIERRRRMGLKSSTRKHASRKFIHVYILLCDIFLLPSRHYLLVLTPTLSHCDSTAFSFC